MRKSAVIIIVLIFISAIYYFVKPVADSSRLSEAVTRVKQLTANAAGFGAAAPASADGTAAAGAVPAVSGDGSGAAAPVSLQNLTPPQLQAWIRQESRPMDSTRNNTDELQLRLRAQAQTLTPEQLPVLTALARDSGQPVNSRILAAYILSLNGSAASTAALYQVAGSTPTDHGPSVAHSEAELKNAQELAIRYMQVDELFARAARDPAARRSLEQLTQTAGSSQVRSYARRKLAELK